jgi:hypothetical protein
VAFDMGFGTELDGRLVLADIEPMQPPIRFMAELANGPCASLPVNPELVRGLGVPAQQYVGQAVQTHEQLRGLCQGTLDELHRVDGTSMLGYKSYLVAKLESQLGQVELSYRAYAENYPVVMNSKGSSPSVFFETVPFGIVDKGSFVEVLYVSETAQQAAPVVVESVVQVAQATGLL